jgi:alkanesulfonate monooxygenase SsuD/methylene tetrahydromethanopterin reductase-like flavin-dependent oxidoreductase (luciferase family)
MNVICADSDEEAALLCSSMDQSFVALRSGNPGKLRPPVPGYRATLPPSALAMLEHMRAVSAVGAPATVADAIARFVTRTGADELIVSGSTFDPAARRRSLELTMKALA